MARVPRRPLSGDWSALIHRLNQRYRQAWDRAERLQAELDNIRGSRVWRLVRWLRRVRRWFARAAPAGRWESPPSPELTGIPVQASGRVSVVIPFRDQPALLQTVLASLRQSTYRRFEVLLLDNGSVCPRTRQLVNGWRRRRGVRCLRCPGPFNFSRLCNLGARRARGDFLLFLNNDTAVLTADWLEQLLRVGAHPEVGVVGATLLYPDETIQHAGLFPVSAGIWSHVYRGRPADFPGDRGELEHVRSVPAVTGACLLIRRSLFRDVGGFREDLPITGNDVDLCCRVRRRGLLVAVTPHARLWHAESLSRGYARDGLGLAI